MDVVDYLSTPKCRAGAPPSSNLPMLHFESLDAATVSWCRDWRAELRMTDLAAEVAAPPVTVGAVDFVLVQMGEGHRPVADRLALLGIREARFGELFDRGQLEPNLDEHDEFCDGMPIFTALLVLDAIVDDLIPASRLRPWSVAEECAT
ncbi:hypothetical protein [Mycolicibacterium goodii]|uniref:hypothetical protein n=1 Tax=Mycolicibacterium goodii TaxID=134601 RepID=UPI00256F037C|nr:hypothetical protein [Mycolicibacterium goodii]